MTTTAAPNAAAAGKRPDARPDVGFEADDASAALGPVRGQMSAVLQPPLAGVRYGNTWLY
jgi:hypothetical protein